MPRLRCSCVAKCFFTWLLLSLMANFTWAQSETATVSGQVVDPSGLNVTGAQVKLVDIDRDTSTSVNTKNTGLYTFPSVRPGRYRMAVTAPGFKVVSVTGITVNVQDHLEQNFKLVVGSISESMTVTADAYDVNTTDATVSTVVDRNFAENLPMNGRSFQTLIDLTPGVVLTASNNADNGQFSVNGQRAVSNYWMVDGVSANVGISSTNQTGNGLSGGMPSLSVLGGTNNLVSVDAMQEFRIQTSTYAPEFGRTPGAQISIVTRSGTNQWHGSLFDYLRNDVLDANDWFADNLGLPKPKERQNDFGGTFGGPIVKDRTFFFFSYEGLRLRLPRVATSSVPDISAREAAVSSMQPFLSAFPIPDGVDDVAAGVAQFNASYTDSATLNAYSLRIDHRLSNKVNLFARYNYSPSTLVQRGGSGFALSQVFPANINIQTTTAGATWGLSPTIINDFRFNYSRTVGNSGSYFDSFDGAVPLSSLPFPSPFTSQNAALSIYTISLFTQNPNALNVGPQGNNLQRQINIVENVSTQRSSHSLRFGVDFRRLSPVYGNPQYQQEAVFLDVPSMETGAPFISYISSTRTANLSFNNLGAFAQDTLRAAPRLTLTYGLRWDVDFAPSGNPNFAAITGFSSSDFSNIGLAPSGTPPFNTTYANIAPRVGIAWRLSGEQERQTVVRGGFGIFYDLVTSEAGNLIYYYRYPFGAQSTVSGGSFPLSSTDEAPPAINVDSIGASGLFAFAPNVRLPYTLQWSLAMEQSLTKQQTVSISYIGSRGHRLIQTADAPTSNPNIPFANITLNAATSDYDALQLQFQRRLSHGLQALVSYTWSHSIDDASAGSLLGNTANAFLPGVANENRGPSDFDIRNAFSAGLTYEIPTLRSESFAARVVHGWALQSFIFARSAVPVNVFDGAFFFLKNDYAQIRPDLIPGQPLYLFGAQCTAALSVPTCPGSMGFNPSAFTPPPTDAMGNPLRQGDLGRNALRAFGATQWDFAVRRQFPIYESLSLQFRAEFFNVLNHPNFGSPVADITSSQFGRSTQTLGQYLGGGNVGQGGLSSLYQIGGPRSIQFAMKLIF